jgi:hypothetical protein
MSNEMADDAEFETFLRDADFDTLLAQGEAMLGTLNEATHAVQGAEWPRVVRTLQRIAEVATDPPGSQPMRDLRLAIESAQMFADLDAALVAKAIQQQGN